MKQETERVALEEAVFDPDEPGADDEIDPFMG